MPGLFQYLGSAAKGYGQGLEARSEQEAREERRRQQAVLFELNRQRTELELQLARADMEDAETIRPLKKKINLNKLAMDSLLEALPAETVTAQPTEGLPGAQPTGYTPITGGMPGAGAAPQMPGPRPTPNLMDVLRMGGTGGGVPQLPLLMPGFGAGARPGMPRGPIQMQTERDPQGRPAAGSGLQATELGRLMAQGAALKGEMTPETAAQMGLTGPEQWSPWMRQQMGEERTPVAQEQWALTRYVALTGIDREDAKLELDRDRVNFDKLMRTKEFEGVSETDLQKMALTLAIAKMDNKTQLQAAGMRARGGGAGAGREPITLTSMNVEVSRLRRAIYGGYDEATGDYVPGLPEGDEREAAVKELDWWQEYRATQGGPPYGGEEQAALDPLARSLVDAILSPKKGAVDAWIEKEGPGEFVRLARSNLEASNEELREALIGYRSSKGQRISAALIARLLTGKRPGGMGPGEAELAAERGY